MHLIREDHARTKNCPIAGPAAKCDGQECAFWRYVHSSRVEGTQELLPHAPENGEGGLGACIAVPTVNAQIMLPVQGPPPGMPGPGGPLGLVG